MTLRVVGKFKVVQVLTILIKFSKVLSKYRMEFLMFSMTFSLTISCLELRMPQSIQDLERQNFQIEKDI